ncbi:PREDICTED: putative nuclease HARBI1 [Trachymyrmex cornetzi]|uniref:putative nuclease HARBI1 n=2 Tax=Trachymyrmex cornetzi TaxID=471704 RepID=UPI00084EEF97|nr:PREDICTED: putative nuclease HARBI1 [Trachymyrmex cornetzi]
MAASETIVSGDIQGVSQASVSRIVTRVSKIIASHLGQYITFSTQERRRQYMNQFYEIANFPSVIGCIDCTHIRIANPGEHNGEIFRNRKGWFSFNVQVVSGPNREILDIVVRHPGSAHDALIFDRSGVRCRFELGHLDGILLGDSRYACRRYLLTPVLRPQSDAELRYNTAHKRTRVTIEQLFGMWKRRFPCLYYSLRTKLSTSVAIICATAVLHNICIQHKLDEIPEQDVYDDVFEAIYNHEEDGIGLAHRTAFITRHFS